MADRAEDLLVFAPAGFARICTSASEADASPRSRTSAGATEARWWRMATRSVASCRGVPSGIRTRVSDVKSRGPGPLDDGDETLGPAGARPQAFPSLCTCAASRDTWREAALGCIAPFVTALSIEIVASRSAALAVL